MDEVTNKLIVLLKSYLGDSGGLYLIQEMKTVGITNPISEQSDKDKLNLANSLLDKILAKVVSPQKLRALESKIYSILELKNKLNSMSSIESIGWN